MSSVQEDKAKYEDDFESVWCSAENMIDYLFILFNDSDHSDIDTQHCSQQKEHWTEDVCSSNCIFLC